MHGNQKTEIVKKHIQPVSFRAFRDLHTTLQALFTVDEVRYISIAESVAKQAYQCSKGDDYRPGYFSELVLTAEGIRLKQTNRTNSRSIDHKDDYLMRDLEFFIPKSDQGGHRNVHDIGNMRVDFSDRSSINNRRCGDFIYAKLQEEKLGFENRAH